MWESRVLQRAFERLELHEGKLSRAVLRGLRHEAADDRYDWSYDQDVTRCATTGTLPRRATGVIRWCELLGQRNLTHPGWPGFSLESPTTASAKAVGGQGGWHG